MSESGFKSIEQVKEKYNSMPNIKGFIKLTEEKNLKPEFLKGEIINTHFADTTSIIYKKIDLITEIREKHHSGAKVVGVVVEGHCYTTMIETLEEFNHCLQKNSK